MSNSFKSELELLLEENRRLKELDRKLDEIIEELAEEQRRLKELKRKQKKKSKSLRLNRLQC